MGMMAACEGRRNATRVGDADARRGGGGGGHYYFLWCIVIVGGDDDAYYVVVVIIIICGDDDILGGCTNNLNVDDGAHVGTASSRCIKYFLSIRIVDDAHDHFPLV